MNTKYTIRQFWHAVDMAVKASVILFLLALVGCHEGEYNVILAIDSKGYHPTMTWTEIREIGFLKKHHTMRISDAEGHPIPLFKFIHEDQGVRPRDETEIHISTPIIVEKKYGSIVVAVFDHGKEVTKVRLVIGELKPVRDEPTAYVAPLNLP